MTETYGRYFRECPYAQLDVYRVCLLFGVTDPALQHALKKILVAGGRGTKSAEQDVREVIASCERWLQMRREEMEAAAGGRIGGDP